MIAKEKRSLQRDNLSIHNTTSYADQHTCPNFLGPGQATLQIDRKPSSDQPNMFEELPTAELAAVSHLPASAVFQQNDQPRIHLGQL